MDNYKKFYSALFKFEKKASAKFNKHFAFMDELLKFYIELITKINPKDRSYDDQDYAVLLFNVKLINSFFCLENLNKKGFIYDAGVLQRQILESIYQCEYIIKNKDVAEKWINGKQISFGSIAKELEIEIEWQEMYGELCNYVHSNIESIQNLLNDDNSINLTPIFDRYTVHSSVMFQILLIRMALDDFYNYFNKYYWINFDKEYEDKKIELDKEYLKLRKNYFKLEPKYNRIG